MNKLFVIVMPITLGIWLCVNEFFTLAQESVIIFTFLLTFTMIIKLSKNVINMNLMEYATTIFNTIKNPLVSKKEIMKISLNKEIITLNELIRNER